MKVLLTKQQAGALEIVLRRQDEQCADISNIVSWKVTDLFTDDEEALNQLDLDTLIRAIYVGYELEPSPEEKLLAYIQELHEQAAQEEIVASAKILGVMKTLEILNIDLKGVNVNGTSSNC